MYKHEMLDQSIKLLLKNMAFLRALEKKITSPDPDSINLEETAQANQQQQAASGLDFNKRKSLQQVLSSAPQAIEKSVADMQTICKNIAGYLF